MRWRNCQTIGEYYQFTKDDFISEKEVCDYIDNNARAFANDVLRVEYKSHDREFNLNGTRRGINGATPQIDFVFRSLKGEIIFVECKFPVSPFAQLNSAIGQILAYNLYARSKGLNANRLCIISTGYHESIQLVILEYKLPIEFIVINKDYCFGAI